MTPLYSDIFKETGHIRQVPSVKGRSKRIDSSSRKDLWLYYMYWRVWPLLRVATEKETTVLTPASTKYDRFQRVVHLVRSTFSLVHRFYHATIT